MNVQVEPGDVWSDADKRRAGRSFKVVSVNNGFVDTLPLSNGSKRTRIHVSRFRPKYYVLKSKEKANASATVQSGAAAKPTAPVVSDSSELKDECSKVLNGTWGGFGKYALFDNGNVNVLVRNVRDTCYDIKVRIHGHLVYSNVLSDDIATSITKVNDFLADLRDNISDIV